MKSMDYGKVTEENYQLLVDMEDVEFVATPCRIVVAEVVLSDWEHPIVSKIFANFRIIESIFNESLK